MTKSNYFCVILFFINILVTINKYLQMKLLLSIAIAAIFLTSCGSKKADLMLTAVSDYAPLVKGKYITYEVDSLVFTNFGTVQAHRFYQVKHEVKDSFRDNSGRLAYKIIRFIRSIPAAGGTSTEDFVPELTFTAVNTGNSYEFVENNQRFIKLTMPIKNAYSWKGNAYISLTAPNFPGVPNSYFLDDWDYTYDDVDGPSPLNFPGFNILNTVTVNQRDVSTNLPVTGTTNIASKDFGKEIYAKNIGMVYRQFTHWEYQTTTKYTGYGITMKMIDKN